MKQIKRYCSPWLVILIAIIGLGTYIDRVLAQDQPNTITFDNRSGEPALVKLIGPSRRLVRVPDNQRRTVNVAAGEYYILVRYGSNPDKYKYSRGDSFTVEQSDIGYSTITITLHKVVDGNYGTYDSSSEEFDKTDP